MNLGYYRGNYTYIGLSIIVIAALSSPIFYVIYALFFFALQRIKSQPEICIGELHLDRPQAGLLLVVVTLFLLLVFGGETFFKAILLSLVLALLHATFHKRPVHAKVASFWNDLWGTEETNPVEDLVSESEGMVSNMMDRVYKYLDASGPDSTRPQPPAYVDVTGNGQARSAAYKQPPSPRVAVPVGQRTRAATDSDVNGSSKIPHKDSPSATLGRSNSVKRFTKTATYTRPVSSVGNSVRILSYTCLEQRSDRAAYATSPQHGRKTHNHSRDVHNMFISIHGSTNEENE
ncbi:hypothetical protein SARC_07196 [Sphaeroforma arctica JP610]|uniref:PRA1 family protein n=1 Tax=Sphaeroforma arctica JP610 TaxID=667725 RepID=A0A0L0FUC2_9EUKA|nr:hypothetical protein SARC_07196 [Sphaeroforma arctica JP610]KNC80445.1 hypothetical protein SARC_07196 [Sphaeroforma arctica JP610]|eukprot:XP_014154347.1 hypothetical protein SARC_07196 [Sphaeroforma arctica JP610]